MHPEVREARNAEDEASRERHRLVTWDRVRASAIDEGDVQHAIRLPVAGWPA